MNMRDGKTAALAALMLLAACGTETPDADTSAAVGPATIGNVTAERLNSADTDPDNWLAHGRTYDEQRFSPLDQINADNVGGLRLAWYHDLDTSRGQEATPIVVDGRMFTTSAWSKVQAFDAATGELLWQFDPEVPGETAINACCDVVNRGVAVWEGRVFVGTLDGRLIALDAETGAVDWSVLTVDPDKAYTITGAPRVVKGKVIIGNGGGEYGVRGYVSAYDAATGDRVWRFYTVPGNPELPFENPALEMAAETWTGEWWRFGGGGTVWDSLSYDPELDLLYIGVGNGSPWNPAVRSPDGGDNLFLSSIVALRPDTGEYVWHYQTTPGDQWDYTATQQMILADLEIDGAVRKVLMQAPKNGFFYVLDRETGELLSAEPFVPVNWASHVDMETGRPAINPDALYHQSGKPWLAMPGPLGAHNWHSMAWNPDTELVYLPAQELGFAYIQDPDFTMKDLAINLGVDLGAASMPEDEDIKARILDSMRGHLSAWDPVAQKEVWRHQHPGPWNGGVLATAGDLVFQGNAAGIFAAYHARTGEKLWSFPAQTGIVAAPVSYRVDGRQYVTIVAGWGGIFPLLAGEVAHVSGKSANRSRVLTFALDGDARLPVAGDVGQTPVEPPEQPGDDAMIADGKALYHRFCVGCHGDAAVSGGVLPDLRWSGMLPDPESWMMVVRDGALSDMGMVGFGSELNDGDIEAIRAYVIARARRTFED